MREIKFREWDPDREKMMPGHGMSYSKREEFDDSVSFRFEHEEDLDYTERQKETDRNGTPYRALEQYTGVNDATGKPIYEGDILQYSNVTVVVDFRHGVFGVQLTDEQRASLPFIIEQCETQAVVIGNIHMNPELLEAD